MHHPSSGPGSFGLVASRLRVRSPFAHTWRAISLAWLLIGTGCGEPDGGSRGGETPAEPNAVLVERDVLDLIAALTPPAEASQTSSQDDWLARQRLALERASRATPEFGLAALDTFEERPNAPIAVRNGLLEAASRANPGAATPVLERLVAQYGEDLGVRTEACRLLGDSAPERAIEVIGPILMDPQRAVTSPADEAMLAAWLRAHELLEREPLPDLALLATDIQRDEPTRHMAVRALGNYPSQLSTSALEEILTESTGNGYLRRLAAQSLVRVLPADELCPLIERVHDRESDLNFQIFLSDVMEKHCR